MVIFDEGYFSSGPIMILIYVFTLQGFPVLFIDDFPSLLDQERILVHILRTLA